MTQPNIFRDEIATTAQLRRTGYGQSTIERRCRSSGVWRKLLPTVVLLNTAEPNRRQLVRATLAYAGPGAVITGVDALNASGLKLPVPAHVHVLIPAARRVNSRAFVHIERTTRPPAPLVKDEIVYAPPARAAMDAARQETNPRTLSTLLIEPLRRGACSLLELRYELEHGSQRGSAQPRQLIAKLAANVHSLAEQQARRVVAGCPIPQPTWNVPISDHTGALLGVADAWWDEVGLAWDFGANEFRVAGKKPQTRAARHHAFTLHQIFVLRTPPTDLCSNVLPLRRALAEAYLRAAERPRPAVHGLGGDRSPVSALGP